ncbi:vault protein inter-alpha-trypsin-like protein [Melghirimyces profundicolus]|uniref:Vault protein inter-alpha-trypsin-like protein n=1 Tax=Melghirimyces profundicolus TaxID=1242148 RepID=A0A2T6C8E1_9BACL|nr:VIT domain-containing protein [Melghirimyces profundicolus]PTX64584.1 vault protein inter-alpha-trypsin-like protein [Melghirimyces profundicolus]
MGIPHFLKGEWKLMERTETVCGLVDREGQRVPLKDVSIGGTVCGVFSQYQLTQRYQNDSEETMEALYTFPLPASASVTSFEVWVGERRLRSEIREKEEAHRVYEDAVQEGNSAFMLAQHRSNVFQVSVGQVFPGEEVTLTHSVFQEWEYEGEGIRISFPTLVAPRYIPGTPRGNRLGTGWADPTDRVPDADRITPPVGEVDYSVQLDLSIRGMAPLTSIQSPSHEIRVNMESEREARVSFARARVSLDRDIVLI